MQIQVSTGDCRVAVGKAIEAAKAKADEDRKVIFEKCFEGLVTGATHNGLDVNEARKQEMRDMASRDVDHMMQKHPSVQLLEVLDNFTEMLLHHKADTITIDDQDFHILKKHLPTTNKWVDV